MTAPVALDPRVCPAGCVIEESQGTCAAVGRGERRWCRGYAAWLCPEAMRVWLEQGALEVPPTLLRERLQGRLPPPERGPTALPVMRPLPSVLQGAPGSLDAYVITAPDLPAKRGGTHREHQLALRAWVHEQVASWPLGIFRMPWLLLAGPPGTGKSFLVRILGRLGAEMGMDVEYHLFDPLLRRVKATRAPDAPMREADLLAPLVQADVLVLDDVRPVFNSQDDENIAHELIAARYGRDRGDVCRTTWLTTNLGRTALQAVIGGAALSRVLGEAKVFVTDWPPHETRAEVG